MWLRLTFDSCDYCKTTHLFVYVIETKRRRSTWKGSLYNSEICGQQSIGKGVCPRCGWIKNISSLNHCLSFSIFYWNGWGHCIHCLQRKMSRANEEQSLYFLYYSEHKGHFPLYHTHSLPWLCVGVVSHACT